MPEETSDAVKWALEQDWIDDLGGRKKVTKNDRVLLVDFVREYFNENKVKYGVFSYQDIKTYF